MIDITYRTLGAWGPGKGANLQASEVDANFWSIAEAINALINDPPEANGIAGISVSGTQMTIVLMNGDTMGPFTLPVLTFRWRGEWQEITAYAQLDVFTVCPVCGRPLPVMAVPARLEPLEGAAIGRAARSAAGEWP